MSNNKKSTSASMSAASQKSAASASLGVPVTTESPAAPEGPSRPARIPMNAGMNLHVPAHFLDREAFAYRYFAESMIKGGRIASAKAAYWEHVTDEKGQNIKCPSGQDTLFLMKLEKQYYEEDQKLKRKKVRATMGEDYSIGEDEYAPSLDGRPEGGTSAVTRR